jgi:Ferritin-like domain
MTKLEKLTELVASPLSRRSFAKGIGLTAAGIAGASVLGTTVLKAAAQAQEFDSSTNLTITDTDVLNFALNLEYLEAEFYLMATWGTTLVGAGILTESETTGATTGGNKVPGIASSPFAFAASGLRTDEVNHVKYLRSALGSAAVKKPAINLSALGYGFSSPSDFLKLGRQFEDVGVSAYAGAAPLIQNKTYLEAAARILGTEAEHAGTLRFACIYWGVNSPGVDGLDVPPTSSHPFDVDSNSLAIARTTAQVLNVVYHGGNCSGGFFPSGMNGNIKCQS